MARPKTRDGRVKITLEPERWLTAREVLSPRSLGVQAPEGKLERLGGATGVVMKRLAIILSASASLFLLSACASDGYYGGSYYGRGDYGYGSVYGGTSPAYRYDGYRNYYGNRPYYDRRYYRR